MLKSPVYIKLKSLNDFARLVCSLERIPIPIYEYRYNNNDIFAAPLDTVNGRSIIYYIDNILSHENQYISYKNTNSIEEATLVDSIKDTSALYSPIIRISKPPQSFLKPTRINNTTKYTGVLLKDLFSLSKLVAYQSVYEESALPLFLFPKYTLIGSSSLKDEKNINYILGTPLNMMDSTDNIYFYYVFLDQPIEKYFLKFSIQKSNNPSFSNYVDEHGFIYLKIIKLDDVHPLLKV